MTNYSGTYSGSDLYGASGTFITDAHINSSTTTANLQSAVNNISYTFPQAGSSTIYVSPQDTSPMCISCGSSNCTYLGTLHINNTVQPEYRCNSCSTIFSKYQGGIAQLVDQAKSTYHTDNVTFVPYVATAGTTYQDPTIKLNDIINRVQQLENTIRNLEYQLTDSLAKLLKIQQDPLHNLRQMIGSFNLK